MSKKYTFFVQNVLKTNFLLLRLSTKITFLCRGLCKKLTLFMSRMCTAGTRRCRSTRRQSMSTALTNPTKVLTVKVVKYIKKNWGDFCLYLV